MKQLLKAACAAGVALSTFGAAHAAAVVNDWYFNPLGTGFATATQIHENLDFVGQGFINITPTGNGQFSFQEYAAFKIAQYDGGPDLPTPNYITALFSASGTGTFGGGFTFNGGGYLEMFSDTVNNFGLSADGGALVYNGANDGASMGKFTVLAGGGGTVDQSGNPTGNGQVIVNAKAMAGDLVSGYFFSPTGEDLNLSDVLSFSFTNANGLQDPSNMLVRELACQFGGVAPVGVNCTTGAGFVGADNPTMLFVGNNGQFKLANQVPEPATLALVGLGLLGVGLSRRRTSKS